MKINKYSKKQIWLWFLMILSIIIFIAVMWFINFFVDTFAETEKSKIKIWVNAIERKSDLVPYTNDFFLTVAEDQERRANMIGQAFLKIATSDIGEDITFYADIITENKTIPCILLNNNRQLIDTKNLDSNDLKKISTKNGLESVLQQEHYQLIPINYYGKSFIYLYYKESKIYTQLRAVFDDLIQSFFNEIVNNAPSIPVIVTDSTQKNIIIFGNLNSTKMKQANYRNHVLANMKKNNPPIKIALGHNKYCYVFYEESMLLKSTRFFPIMLFILFGLFAVLAYILLSKIRQSEQNQVWIGMSKETAHQLGTPISSLMAWAELLKEYNVNQEVIDEINKDINHLEIIAQRFSKIGSLPSLKTENINNIILNFIDYFKNRTSSQIHFEICMPKNDIFVPLSKHLFEWVLENICKNAVDAMNGVGNLTIDLSENKKYVFVDITDTGKGIESQYQKTIFKPGYTTKERGWGLGLTLAQRIINQYHKGELKLKESVLNQGSTFRIKLKK